MQAGRESGQAAGTASRAGKRSPSGPNIRQSLGAKRNVTSASGGSVSANSWLTRHSAGLVPLPRSRKCRICSGPRFSRRRKRAEELAAIGRRMRRPLGHQCFGAYPDLTAGCLAPPRRRSAKRCRATCTRPNLPIRPSGEQIDRRAADELRNLHVRRLLVQLGRAGRFAGCGPASIMATRSDIVIASVWSCVT